jgi:hypothetical protein
MPGASIQESVGLVFAIPVMADAAEHFCFRIPGCSTMMFCTLARRELWEINTLRVFAEFCTRCCGLLALWR